MSKQLFTDMNTIKAIHLLEDDMSLKQMINHAMHVFPKAFINRSDEFILVPKYNVYFRLRGMDNALDFKVKMFSWLSRPISKGLKRKPAHKLLDCFNALLNTQFTMEDMSRIYTELGNDCNRELCIRFIDSGYDMSLLQYEKETSL